MAVLPFSTDFGISIWEWLGFPTTHRILNEYRQKTNKKLLSIHNTISTIMQHLTVNFCVNFLEIQLSKLLGVYSDFSFLYLQLLLTWAAYLGAYYWLGFAYVHDISYTVIVIRINRKTCPKKIPV